MTTFGATGIALNGVEEVGVFSSDQNGENSNYHSNFLHSTTNLVQKDYNHPNVRSSTRPATAINSQRVKVAATEFINKKWGYKAANILQGYDFTSQSFASQKTFRKEHRNWMGRLDKGIEF